MKTFGKDGIRQMGIQRRAAVVSCEAMKRTMLRAVKGLAVAMTLGLLLAGERVLRRR